jgi:hypothetical protein
MFCSALYLEKLLLQPFLPIFNLISSRRSAVFMFFLPPPIIPRSDFIISGDHNDDRRGFLTMFSLLLSRPGVKSDLAGLSLNQEDSQKELEGVWKMAQRRTLQRRSSGSESAAKNIPISPGPRLKKAKSKRSSIFNCLT